MSGIEALDFSGLFKLEALVHMDVISSCFYEVGLKKMIALAGKTALEFFYLTPIGDRRQKTYDWDFKLHPIRCMCFEPSGTWLLVASDCNLFLVPFLPLFEPNSNYDRKWSLTDATAVPFVCDRPATLAWWLTKEAENITIVALRCGLILFYSLDSKTIVGETKVHAEVADVQVCVDDSLDLLVLLITGTANQQWKLVLEHRCVNYNWIRVHATAPVEAKERRDGLMAYIKDKFTTFSQGSSEEKMNPVEYFKEPTDYLPTFRRGSHDWSLSVQYVNGRHFITAFDTKAGTVILESTEEDTPSRTLHPRIQKDSNYRQALWCQKLLYILTDSAVEVHSASFSVIQGSTQESAKEDTCLWRAELPSELRRAYLLSPRAAAAQPPGWSEPTFMCDLQLPRFTLEPCLMLGSHGAFLLTTMTEPCEWIVGLIMRGGHGAERSAAALGAPVDTLLRAAADMLLSRFKLLPAKYLYSLSKSPPDGWVARLGVFGLLPELAAYRLPSSNSTVGYLSNPAVVMRILAQLLMIATSPDEATVLDTQCPNLTSAELGELCDLSAALGLWEVLPVYSLHRGLPQLVLSSIGARRSICRGALKCLLREDMLPFLLDCDASFLYSYLNDNLRSLDTVMLKRFCLWLSPLNEQVRPVLRDLKDGRTNIYTTRLIQLMGTFARIVSEIDAREPSPTVQYTPEPEADVWREKFTPRRVVSCGLMHWAIADGGDAHVMLVNTPIKTQLIGRVVSVACGRHHTVVLTENGVYAAGDNSHGQLGAGERWPGATGEGAAAGGALLRVRGSWDARVCSVAAGHYHSAALDTGGRLYTWGWGVHGQLGLGNTDDALRPQLVTRLQGRKVLQVGCGACHTAVLMRNGEVWAFGAGAFGQLGSGGRGKSSLPVRVLLQDPVCALAVGYFHNLALTEKCEVWTWGASPQSVRAAVTHARRAATPPPDDVTPEPHLQPALLNTEAVQGRIVQMSAGWHHSCLLSHTGNIYTWGLNFDGQLGSGDRKQIIQPTQVNVPLDMGNAEDVRPAGGTRVHSADAHGQTATTKSMIACGGDFTVFVDSYGKIYIAGNTHQQSDTGKHGNRVIMMKTTRRVIKIPANRANNKFLFQYADKFDNFLVSNPDVEREMIGAQKNPLTVMSDFKNEKWADEILHTLKPWINEADVCDNPNVAAKLAYHNKMYSECLKLQLRNVTTTRNVKERLRLNEATSALETDVRTVPKREDRKSCIVNTVTKRIKELGIAVLNERPYPESAVDIYAMLPCSCDDINPLPKIEPDSEITFDKDILAHQAAQIVDDSLSTFPANCEAWEEYLGLAKSYFLEHSLPGEELETVLEKYVEGNASMVSSAVMFSDECASYEELFTPKFYLTMCSKLLDTWG